MGRWRIIWKDTWFFIIMNFIRFGRSFVFSFVGLAYTKNEMKRTDFSCSWSDFINRFFEIGSYKNFYKTVENEAQSSDFMLKKLGGAEAHKSSGEFSHNSCASEAITNQVNLSSRSKFFQLFKLLGWQNLLVFFWNDLGYKTLFALSWKKTDRTRHNFLTKTFHSRHIGLFWRTSKTDVLGGFGALPFFMVVLGGENEHSKFTNFCLEIFEFPSRNRCGEIFELGKIFG